MKILVVDDEKLLVKGVKFNLENEGYEVMTAYDGASAVELTRKEFDLPLAPKGTAFQQAVWAEMNKIPYGQTRTYGQLAAAIGRPKAARAVGGACHCNPIAIIQPCHRVVGSSGKLTGYAYGVEMKEYLLELEQQDDRSFLLATQP